MTQDPRPAPVAAAPAAAVPATDAAAAAAPVGTAPTDAAPATGAPVGAATTRTAPSSHMRGVRRLLLGLAVFQGLSTLVGFVELLLAPHYFAFLLDGTAFAGRYALAAVLLGVVVGGFQWAAVVMHLRAPRWLPAAHALAGLVMLGWIAGECLVLGVFMWPHALWGGVGAIQLLLVTVLMGAFRPQPGLRPRSARLPARERAAPPDS